MLCVARDLSVGFTLNSGLLRGDLLLKDLYNIHDSPAKTIANLSIGDNSLLNVCSALLLFSFLPDVTTIFTIFFYY